MAKLKIERSRYLDFLFLATIMFFVLSMIHIALAWLGMICMILPFVLYFRTGDKVWCKYYCPRASLFKKVISKISIGLKPPKWLTYKNTKTIVLYYFIINVSIAVLSSIMVSIGRVAPLEHVRILIMFNAPFTLPQLLDWQVHPGLLHASYRIFSMMFTSTMIGSLLGILYKPRTWCAICPIQTLTTQSVNKGLTKGVVKS